MRLVCSRRTVDIVILFSDQAWPIEFACCFQKPFWVDDERIKKNTVQRRWHGTKIVVEKFNREDDDWRFANAKIDEIWCFDKQFFVAFCCCCCSARPERNGHFFTCVNRAHLRYWRSKIVSNLSISAARSLQMTGGWCDDSGPRWWGRKKPTEPCTSHCDLSGCLRCRLRCVSLSLSFLNFKQLTALSIYFFPLFCSLALSSQLCSLAHSSLSNEPCRRFAFLLCVAKKWKWNKRRKKQRYIKQPSTATVCDSTTALKRRELSFGTTTHTRKRRMNLAPTINCYLAIISWIFPLSHHFFFCAGRLQFS